ncbi:hypothetical protein Zmor_027452 [Zophobas morio]|uniref:Uncharacterized protein n=1 Tax=Zophobas morio TaxID=2755281 RepID=A0AA38HTL7_9CUCU|nr:hypothetical protein Zmor_027452 [Zophobas morio]
MYSPVLILKLQVDVLFVGSASTLAVLNRRAARASLRAHSVNPRNGGVKSQAFSPAEMQINDHGGEFARRVRPQERFLRILHFLEKPLNGKPATGPFMEQRSSFGRNGRN